MANQIRRNSMSNNDKHGHHEIHGHHDIDDIMHKLEDFEDKLKSIENGVYCFNVN